MPGVTQKSVYSESYLAAADQRASAGLFVKQSTSVDGTCAICGAGELAIGVILEGGNTGQASEIQVLGTARVKAGAAINRGDYVKSDAAGKAAVAVKGRTDTSDAGAAADPLLGSHVVGQARTTCANADEFIEVLILHLGAVPTTAS